MLRLRLCLLIMLLTAGGHPSRLLEAGGGTHFGFLPRAMALHIVIASAAAVASSSREALAICMPVSSQIMVW
jgi:hypothetical protein